MHCKRVSVDPGSSQRVTVNGMEFNWANHHTGHVMIQHASGHGCTVVLVPDEGFRPEHVPIAIELALDTDWEPQQDGPNHWFRFDAHCGIGGLSTMEPHDEVL